MRLLQHLAPADVDVRAVVQECGVQGSKGVALGIEITAEMGFEPGCVCRELIRKAVDVDSSRQIAQRGEIAGKASIDEDQLARGAGQQVICLELFRPHIARRCERERGLRDGRDIGEAPVFIVSGREAGLGKAREGILAQFLQPDELAASGGLLELAEAREISFKLFGRGNHVLLSPYIHIKVSS